MDRKFLMDSNCFITPANLYYAFDIVPAFWKEIVKKDRLDRIVLLDLVKKEIDKGRGVLTDWVDNDLHCEVCNHNDAEIVRAYSEVINYVFNCGLYKQDAGREWSNNDVADAWLIAAAAAKGYCLVTFEARAGGLSSKTPSTRAKIPDVADHFNVPVVNLFEMMRLIGIKI